MSETFRQSLDADTPPDGLSAAEQALWWIAKGDFITGPAWEQAHQIAQQHEGTQAFDAIHALLHRIEGDTGNAAYWDRRAGTDFGQDGPQAEWARLTKAFASG